MRKILFAVTAAILMGLPVLAQNVEVKWTGPDGQGNMVWWYPPTGRTNMVVYTNGLQVDVVGGKLAIDGTNVTATAAALNAGSGSSVSLTSGVGTFTTVTGTAIRANNSLSVGTNATVGGVVDAASFTADAAAGIDVQAAGALKVGATTATSVDYGSASVTAHTFASDGTGTAEFVVPAGSIGSDELATAVQTAVAASLAVTCTTNANGGTNVLVVTAKDLNGATLATNVFFRCWIGDTAGSVPAEVAGAFTVSNGTEIQEIVDKGDYYVMTAAAGTVTITISDTPGVTNYFHAVASGGRVGLTTMAWNIVP